MKRQEYKIIFEPTGRQVYALPGTILLEAAAQAGLILQTPCGGSGRCGKCRLKVVSGACPPSVNCRPALGEADVAQGYRLACQARIQGDLVVEVPVTSLFESQQQILVQAADAPPGSAARRSSPKSQALCPGEMELCPAISKHFVELDMPSQTDARSDVERLRLSLIHI